MCGIVGYISLQGEPVGSAYLKKMAEAQRHRGPDHTGEYCNGPVALGSQRLAIIDLQGGNQPISNEDGSVVIVYNGELYNYKEIRRLLKEKGHTFATASDTEVLVHAYENMGPGFVSQLNGMFTFALWDSRCQRLMLGRDHLGMKPLYYMLKNGTLWFASEVKSLLSLPHLSAELDPQALAEYLLYQNLFAEKSLFRYVNKVRAGHYMMAERGQISDHQYWDVPLDEHRGVGLEDHLAEYRSRLDAAVGRHLVSDVEVGSYLSGGYDSTAVALLAAQKLDRGLHTFTGAFLEDSFYDERLPARTVASQCGATLHEVPISALQFWEALDPVCYAMDEPSVGCAAIPQYLVAREVAKHVKVVLTGHGGDELLLGYEAYKAVYMRQMLKSSPRRFLALCQSVSRTELPRVAYFFFATNPITRHGIMRFFDLGQIRSLMAPNLRVQLGDYDPLEALRKVLEPVAGAPAIQETIYLYLKTYLPTLLIQEDKVGMAHSVESRMPICDRELVEFLASVPVHQKLHHGQLKYFPKAALRDLYPPQILQQPKRGFPTPIARWFRGELREELEQRFFGPESKAGEVFDLVRLRHLWRRFQSLSGDSLRHYYLANQLYSLLTMVVWYELFICGRRQSAQGALAGRIDGKT